jgi:hypothetical protein
VEAGLLRVPRADLVTGSASRKTRRPLKDFDEPGPDVTEDALHLDDLFRPWGPAVQPLALSI